MSLYNKRSVALKSKDDSSTPIVVASGLGYMAEKIVEIATENDIPVYQDASLTSLLSSLEIGKPIPDNLFHTITEMYAYFTDILNEKDNIQNKEQLVEIEKTEDKE